MPARTRDEKDVSQSVCLSMGPSVRPHVNARIVTKWKKDLSRFFIPYERSFSLVLREEEWLVEGDFFYLKFWVNRPPLEQNSRFSVYFCS